MPATAREKEKEREREVIESERRDRPGRRSGLLTCDGIARRQFEKGADLRWQR
jgi:hypothetical protein